MSNTARSNLRAIEASASSLSILAGKLLMGGEVLKYPYATEMHNAILQEYDALRNAMMRHQTEQSDTTQKSKLEVKK